MKEYGFFCQCGNERLEYSAKTKRLKQKSQGRGEVRGEKRDEGRHLFSRYCYSISIMLKESTRRKQILHLHFYTILLDLFKLLCSSSLPFVKSN